MCNGFPLLTSTFGLSSAGGTSSPVAGFRVSSFAIVLARLSVNLGFGYSHQSSRQLPRSVKRRLGFFLRQSDVVKWLFVFRHCGSSFHANVFVETALLTTHCADTDGWLARQYAGKRLPAANRTVSQRPAAGTGFPGTAFQSGLQGGDLCLQLGDFPQLLDQRHSVENRKNVTN
jgi:hypothetical protein